MATVKILADVFARGERILKKDDVAELDGDLLARVLRRGWGVVSDTPAETSAPVETATKGKRKG